MTFSINSKTKTYSQNTQNYNIRNQSHIRRPQIKNSENRQKLKFKYIINDIFKNIKN